MPHITIDNDPATFTLDLIQGGRVSVNMYGYTSRLAAAAASEGITDLGEVKPDLAGRVALEAIRVLEAPPDALTAHDAYAIVNSVGDYWTKLGNAPGQSPTSPPRQ